MRNSFHIFIGFTILYLIGSLTGFAEFTLYSKVVGVSLISITVGWIIGFDWEGLQTLVNPKVFDWNDIIRTTLGTLLGGVLSIFYPDIQWLLWGSCGISVILIGKELLNYYKNKQHGN